MSELKLERVCYQYKNSRQSALNNVCCTLRGGSINAIIGPSGSGKTTLLSIMAGLDRPMEGQVYLDEKDINGLDLDQYRREHVSMIFQSFQLFPLLSALENVSYPMEMRGIKKELSKARAKELLASVDISGDMCKRYPGNLSGGEQQRVAIARALSSGARVLLADEPTGNLDTANGDKVMEILKRLAHEEGYCIVIVTHDPNIAKAADAVYRMKDGVLNEEVS